MNRNRMLSLPAALLALILLTGCGAGRGVFANYRPIEALLLVETLGLDLADSGGLWLSAAAARDAEGVETLDAFAPGLVQGLEALQDRAGGGRVFFSHCQSFVLGEDYARRGVGGLFDYVERDIHTRMGAHLFVVRDSAAAALVAGGDSPQADVSALLAAVRSETEARGDSHVFDVRETAVALSEQGAGLICALRLIHAGESAEAGLSAVPAGYGILKDGRLVGYLDWGEARAASLLLGVLGRIPLSLTTSTGGAATVYMRCGAPEIRCRRREDGGLALDLRAAPEAELAAVEGGADWTDPAAAAALATAVNEAIRDDLDHVLARAKALDADFLALSRVLRRAGFDLKTLPADWLRTLEATVTVDTTLTRSDGLAAPLGVAGGGA